MTTSLAHDPSRWRFRRVRRVLRPANRLPLDAWVSEQGRRLEGLVLNVGAGEDDQIFGRRTVRLDAFAPHATVRADLAHHLPFCDAMFDGAVCTEVLEHVPQPSRVLREIVRVLKPGGTAIVTMPFLFHYHPDPEDYSRLSAVGLRLELERAGFEVEFLAGLGGKVMAALLLAESIHPVSKVIVRLALLPLRPWLAARPLVNGRWSDYAANIVAVVRTPRHANP